jgi:hypothetical protein
MKVADFREEVGDRAIAYSVFAPSDLFGESLSAGLLGGKPIGDQGFRRISH